MTQKNANLSILKMLMLKGSARSVPRNKLKILEQNVDYLGEIKEKTGEPGTSHKIMIEELQTFASSFESFKKGQRITIQEHYDALGWDLVEDQGTGQ